MLPKGFYLPTEFEVFQQPMIYVNTIYKKSKHIDKYIEIAKTDIPEENCYQMLLNTNGRINAIGRTIHWDDISYSIIFNCKNEFVYGEIYFNDCKYETNNQNEFNGMCDKFVKWSNNLYGLIDKMTNNVGIKS